MLIKRWMKLQLNEKINNPSNGTPASTTTRVPHVAVSSKRISANDDDGIRGIANGIVNDNGSGNFNMRDRSDSLHGSADTSDDLIDSLRGNGYRTKGEQERPQSRRNVYNGTPSRSHREFQGEYNDGIEQIHTPPQTHNSFARSSAPSSISRFAENDISSSPPSFLGSNRVDRAGQESVLRNNNGQESVLRNKNGQESVHRNNNGQESVLRNNNGQVSVLRNNNGQESVLRNNNGQESVLRNNNGQESVLRNNNGQESVLRNNDDSFNTTIPTQYQNQTQDPSNNNFETNYTIPGVSRQTEWEKSSVRKMEREGNSARERPFTAEVLNAWTSSPATEILSRQLQHLVDSSIERYDRNTSQRRRSYSTPRPVQSNAEVRRQAAICSRLTQGIAVTDRYVPVIRAKCSPHRRRENTSFSLDISDERDRYTSPEYSSAPVCSDQMAKYRKTVEDVVSMYGYGQQTPVPSRSSTVKMKKKNRKKSKERVQIEAQKNAFEGIVSNFSDTVRDISMSLGVVTEQLRDVTGSLSASVSVMDRSQFSQSSGSPNKSMSSVSFNRTNNSFAAGFDPSPAMERIKQVHVRTNGNTTLTVDRRDVCDEQEQNESQNSKMRFEEELPGEYQQQSSAPRYPSEGNLNYSAYVESPIRRRESLSEIGINADKGKPPHHNYSNASPSDNNENGLRKTQRVPRSNDISSSSSSSSSSPFASHLDNGIAFCTDRNITDQNKKEISHLDMTNLIRERLKKKLNAVLRPSSS